MYCKISYNDIDAISKVSYGFLSKDLKLAVKLYDIERLNDQPKLYDQSSAPLKAGEGLLSLNAT
jgi:hypothetical protein